MTVPADDGLQLGVTWFGEHRDQNVLFLHGSFGHARVWDFVAAQLPEDIGAAALDLPGHGRSQRAHDPRRYAFDLLVGDVRAAIDAMPPRPVLVGHSIGSGLAMLVAAAHPGLLSGVVLVDIDPYPPISQVKHLNDVGSAPPKVYEDFGRAVARESRVAPGAPAEVHRHLAEHGYAKTEAGWVQGFDQAFLRAVTQWDARPLLSGIELPALVVRGAESTVMSPEGYELLVAGLPNSRGAILEGAGHQVPLECPGEFAGLLGDFVLACKQG